MFIKHAFQRCYSQQRTFTSTTNTIFFYDALRTRNLHSLTASHATLEWNKYNTLEHLENDLATNKISFDLTQKYLRRDHLNFVAFLARAVTAAANTPRMKSASSQNILAKELVLKELQTNIHFLLYNTEYTDDAQQQQRLVSDLLTVEKHYCTERAFRSVKEQYSLLRNVDFLRAAVTSGYWTEALRLATPATCTIDASTGISALPVSIKNLVSTIRLLDVQTVLRIVRLSKRHRGVQQAVIDEVLDQYTIDELQTIDDLSVYI